MTVRNHNLQSAVCIIALLISFASAKAAEFKLAQDNNQPGISIVYLSGAINEGDTEKLVKLLRSDLQITPSITNIWLNSSGGDLNEAIKIGALIEKLGYTAIVPTGATCASACFFTWVSASGRLAPGELIIHRPYFDMRNASHGAGFEESYRITNEAARLYLRQRNVPTNLINLMMQMSSADGYALTQNDKWSIGPLSPARMEYMVQNCGLPNANDSRGILEHGGLSGSDQKAMRACSLGLYEAQKHAFFFGGRDRGQ